MALSKAARGAVGIIMLLCSTSFMNVAWYMHLKFESWSLVQSIFISWSIALPEYSLQVPANRIAHVSHGGPFSAPQLKVIAELFSLVTFAVFSAVVLKEKLRWVDLGAFALIFGGVLLSLLTRPPTTSPPPPSTPPPPPPPEPSSAVVIAEVQLKIRHNTGGRKRTMDALGLASGQEDAAKTSEIGDTQLINATQQSTKEETLPSLIIS